MSSRRRASRRLLGPSSGLAVAVALLFTVSACISVSNEGQLGSTPRATVGVTLPDASPTIAPLASATPTPTPEPTPEPVDAEVLGFIPGWLLEQAAPSIDSDLITIAALHSVEAAADGRLVSRKPSGNVPPGWEALESEAFAQLKDRLQSAGVKVVPVIQRVGWTEGTAKRTQTLLSKRKNRRTLARRIADLVETRGFDGVNLDFEPVPAKLAAEYVELVREVRAALDGVAPGLHLSVDVLPGLDGFDLASLVADDAADMAVIMGYNLRGDGARVAGSTAPLHDADGADLATAVAAAREQVSPDRVVLALPWYGKAWATETDKAGSPTIRGKGIDEPSDPHYAVAVGFATRSGRRYEPDQASAWTVYADRQCPSCPAVWRQVWYDDPDSFGAKVDHAVEQGLAGVGVWALGMESGRDEMWAALRHSLRPGRDTVAPSGNAGLDPERVRGDLEGRDVVQGAAPLQLFAADNTGGSGLMLVRIGLSGETGDDGRLLEARSYPAASATVVEFPLGDPETGGAAEPGPRDIYVQWRDIAGNWSTPLVVEAWASDPATTPTPADL